jgi:hypothetical protein
VRDSGYFSAGIGAPPLTIHWLDNDRLITSGFERGLTEPRADGVQVPKRGLYIWDLKTDRVTRYADAAGHPCYHAGYITYPIRNDGPLINGIPRFHVVKEGPFGSERERTIDRSEHRELPPLNPFSCREYDRARLRMNGYQGKPLLEEHGILDLGPSFTQFDATKKDDPIHLVKPDGSRIAVPITRLEGTAIFIGYTTFNKAYTLASSIPKDAKGRGTVPWPRGRTQPVYILSPSGGTRRIDIPYIDARASTSILYLATAGGVYMMSHRVSTGHDGAYLVQGEKVILLEPGYVVAHGVSPDGCRLALGIRRRFKSKEDERDFEYGYRLARLKVVQLCKKEGAR